MIPGSFRIYSPYPQNNFLFSTKSEIKDKPGNNYALGDDLDFFLLDGMNEIDFYQLEESLDRKVEVASLFAEDELVVGSTVSSITPEKWKMLGAKRTHEALGNEMSVVSYTDIIGAYISAIRGYAQSGAEKGIATLVDGVPLNEYINSSSAYTIPNWDLGTLNRIELIKGPGSAIYGSDAFHGVISMKTFESDKNHYSLEGAGAYPLYGDANLKLSQGFADDFLRVDFSAGASYQGDQNLKYKYADPEGYTDTTYNLMNIPADKGTAVRDYKYNSQTGVLKLRLKPADKINLKFGAYLNQGKYDSFPGLVSVVNPLSSTGQMMDLQDNDLSWNETLFLMANSQMDYTFANRISVEASGHYWESEKKYSLSAAPTSYEIISTTDSNITRNGAQVVIKQPDNALNLQWLIAYSYSAMKVKSQERSIYIAELDPALRQFIPKFTSLIEGKSRNIHSTFGQLKWGAIKNRFYFLLGGRNDYYSDFGNQTTPRIGLIYLPTEKSSIKALYGRAFRAPTPIEQTDSLGVAKGDPNIKPEIIDSYELSYMYKEKKWKAAINTFYSKWKNAITLEYYQTVDFKNRYVNRGKNDAIGGELNLFYPIEPVTFDLGCSYVKSRTLNIPSTEDPAKTINQDYSAFPEYSINAGLYYTLKPVNTSFYLNNILYLNMTEAPESAKQNPEKLPPYYRMDINVSKNISDKFELYLNVKNVLNRENRMPSIYGAPDGYVEPGIGVMLRAGYKL